MELINTNSENSFDPTPRLKSSPVPILFISFNYDENKCSYCIPKQFDFIKNIAKIVYFGILNI